MLSDSLLGASQHVLIRELKCTSLIKGVTFVIASGYLYIGIANLSFLPWVGLDEP